ncbi:hypothetical protein ACM25O_13230 [Sulfitobacter pontiacus]
MKWDCTAEELAEAVHEDPAEVQGICNRRGWPLNAPAEPEEAFA